jgi:hypothetical protein
VSEQEIFRTRWTRLGAECSVRKQALTVDSECRRTGAENREGKTKKAFADRSCTRSLFNARMETTVADDECREWRESVRIARRRVEGFTRARYREEKKTLQRRRTVESAMKPRRRLTGANAGSIFPCVVWIAVLDRPESRGT